MTRGLLVSLFLLLFSTAAAADHQDSMRHVRLADRAFAQGQSRTARIELMNATDSDPANAVAWVYLARVSLALSDGESAEAALDKAIAAGFPRERTLHYRAHALILQQHAQPALDMASSAAIPAGYRGYAARIRAKARFALGDMAGAAPEFDKALSLIPKDAALWIDVSRFRLASGERAGAIAASERAVALGPNNVAALVLRGILVRDQYGLRASLPWFDKALAIDQLDLDAQLERAATLGEMGRTIDMLKATRTVLAQEPGNPRALYLQAVLAARARNFPLARTLVNATNGALDGTPALMLLQATLAYQEGNMREAIDRLSPLLEQQPNNLKVRDMLAATLWQARDFEAVIAALQPVADTANADSYTLALIGRAYEALGNRVMAVTYLDRAALYPGDIAQHAIRNFDDLRAAAQASEDDAAPKVDLIRALMAAGQNEEALRLAQALENANPGADEAHVLAGDVWSSLGRNTEAIEAYRRAANLHFSETVALHMIDTFRKGSQPLAAQQVLTLFVQQNPRNISTLLLYADMLMGQGRFGTASRILERVHSQRGYADIATTNNLAWCYYYLDRPAAALEAVDRAYRMMPANASLSHSYGWMLYKSGRNPTAAAEFLFQAAGQAPGWPTPRRHLAELLATRSPHR